MTLFFATGSGSDFVFRVIFIATFFLNSIVTGCFFFHDGDATPQIELAVQWAIDIANDQSHGYSQGADYPPYQGSRDGPDYDCSSLIYYALDRAGFNVIDNWKKNPLSLSRYNGNQLVGDADTLWQDLGEGWHKFSWNEVKDNLKRGDILANPHHVAFYIGDGMTVEARGVNNPRGGSYVTGDQGGEIDFYPAFNRYWTEVYRFGG